MMDSRKTALATAKQFRTCPPPAVFKGPHHGAEVRKHLAVCPHCAGRSDGTAEMDMWNAVSEKILAGFPVREAQMRVAEKKTGCLCPVRGGAGIWHGGLYYNPPCVLIVDSNAAYPQAVQVAQIYHDPSMAAPGDLILLGEQTDWGECFAEPWNLYTLKTSDLDDPVGCVPDDIVAWVRRMADDPGALPEWAAAPKPLVENDPRIYFRELEVTVGYLFSSRSVSELIQASERPPVNLIYASTEELIGDMRRKIPGIRWPAEPPTEAAALAAANLPPEYYAQAAADEGGEKVPVNLFALRSGRLFHTTSATAVVMRRERAGTGLEIGGRIRGLPAGMRDSGLCCYLFSEETGYLMPETVDWQETTGDFMVGFEGVASEAVNLYIGVVHDLDAE